MNIHTDREAIDTGLAGERCCRGLLWLPINPFCTVFIVCIVAGCPDQSVLLGCLFRGWGGDDGGFRGRGLCWWSLLLMRACWPIFVWMAPEKRRWWGKFIRRWLEQKSVLLPFPVRPTNCLTTAGHPFFFPSHPFYFGPIFPSIPCGMEVCGDNSCSSLGFLQKNNSLDEKGRLAGQKNLLSCNNSERDARFRRTETDFSNLFARGEICTSFHPP